MSQYTFVFLVESAFDATATIAKRSVNSGLARLLLKTVSADDVLTDRQSHLSPVPESDCHTSNLPQPDRPPWPVLFVWCLSACRLTGRCLEWRDQSTVKAAPLVCASPYLDPFSAGVWLWFADGAGIGIDSLAGGANHPEQH